MAGKKEPFHFIRFVLTGLLWSILYIPIMGTVCALLSFNPLSYDEWNKQISDFLSVEWIIDTRYDAALLLCMLLFVPLWVVGWRIFYKIRWQRFIPRVLLKRHVKKKTVTYSGAKKTFVPTKLRVQTSALLSVSAIDRSMGNTQNETGNNAGSMNEEGEQFDVQQIEPYIADLAADLLPDIRMDSLYASFALASDSKALIVRALNQPDSTWIADLDVDVADCDWYNESSVMEKPLNDIIQITKTLRESEDNSQAFPVILLMSGTLMNAPETLAYLQKNDILLLRFPEAEADGVPLFVDFVKEFFGTRVQTTDANDEDF